MKKNHLEKTVDTHATPHGTYKSYSIGFLISLALTLISFLLVSINAFSRIVLISVIVCLALIQLIVQLEFFMNLGKEAKPRWNTVIFLFMATVVGILVFGSLWIMWELDDRVMTPMEMKDLHHQE
jgi:cytochrome o ubiquinol oxidase subunit IV